MGRIVMLGSTSDFKFKKDFFAGLGLLVVLSLGTFLFFGPAVFAAPAAKPSARKLKIESEVKSTPAPESASDLFATEPRDSALPTEEYASPVIVKPAATPAAPPAPTPKPLEVQTSVPVAPAPVSPEAIATPALNGASSTATPPSLPAAIPFDADQLPTGE